MNYTPNTQQWRLGDIVLHDADEKSPRMLMLVMGFTRDGLAKTQYVDRRRRRMIWKNELKYLHNPSRFGINPDLGYRRQDLLESSQFEWENCRIWNNCHKPGIRVEVTSGDGGFETVTIGPAFFNYAGYAQIPLEQGGNWSLKFVLPVKAAAS